MNERLALYLDLLHGGRDAVLATHAQAMPGFPYASQVRIVPDERHRPVMLLSHLAEHARNIAADDRASLLLQGPRQGYETPRVTLIGHLQPMAEPAAMLRRFLRYLPEAEPLTQLGDFALYRFQPRRARPVGGFAMAGWFEGRAIDELPHLELASEEALLPTLAARLPPGVRLLGLDAFGADLQRDDGPLRLAFKPSSVLPPALITTYERALTQWLQNRH